jgi:hypothetical protein
MTNKNEMQDNDIFEDDIFLGEPDDLDIDNYEEESDEEEEESSFDFSEEDLKDIDLDDEFDLDLIEEEVLPNTDEIHLDDDYEDDTNDLNEDYSDDDDSDTEDETNPFDDDEYEEDDNEEDLFKMVKPKRKAKLPEADYPAVVGEVKVEKKTTGDYGPWVKTEIPFKIKHPKTGETITVPFFASKSTNKKSRLYPIIKGILGNVPDDEYSLKDLEGKKVCVTIEHREDGEGSVWDNVILVRPLQPKK